MGNGIQVIDAAIPAMGPDRFVFRLLGQEMAVFVIIGAGTANDATPVAAMGGQPSPGGFQFGLGFPADLGGTGKPAFLEIIGRITAGFVQDIGQDIRSIGRKTLTGDRVAL